MRLRYFVITLSIITILALAYTWQETEIIRLAYLENQKNKALRELLDINYSLRYNLISLKSSSNLGKKLLGESAKFEMPKPAQIEVLPLPKETPRTIGAQEVFIKNGVILSVFKVKESWPVSFLKSYIDRQAQADDFASIKY